MYNYLPFGGKGVFLVIKVLELCTKWKYTVSLIPKTPGLTQYLLGWKWVQAMINHINRWVKQTEKCCRSLSLIWSWQSLINNNNKSNHISEPALQTQWVTGKKEFSCCECNLLCDIDCRDSAFYCIGRAVLKVKRYLKIRFGEWGRGTPSVISTALWMCLSIK